VSWARNGRHRLEAGAARAVLGGIAALPLGGVVAAARLAGSLAYQLWGERRPIAIENLLASGLAPTPAEARRIARESFRTFALMVAESAVALRKLTPDNWRECISMHWSEEVRTLFESREQGLIFASAHIGNWEIAARAASMVRPLVYVHRPLSNPYLQKLTYGGRIGANLKLVSSLDRDPFRFLEMLARGDLLGLMIDQHAGDQRLQVEFLGRPAWTTKSVAMLHLLTRVPVIPAFAIRTGPLRYAVHFGAPVRHRRTGDREADAFAVTQSLTHEVERIVRQFPGQYMWGHRRWKP
jgi:KDO2-lipid IV(A) lauroyltransferase